MSGTERERGGSGTLPIDRFKKTRPRPKQSRRATTHRKTIKTHDNIANGSSNKQ